MVFVRHALPGEEVMAVLTDAAAGARFWRADAVEVLTASPDRVAARCPVSGPGGCGGCDFQHVDLAAQRRLKATVVAEQLRRLAGLDLSDVVVEAVPGDQDGLGWRTRVRFAVDDSGRAGLRAHRSHEVVPLTGCPLAHRRVAELGVPRRRWPGCAAVEVVAPAAGEDRLVVLEPRREGRRVDAPPLSGPASLARVSAPDHGHRESRDGRVGQREPEGRGDGAALQRLRGRTWVAEEVAVDGVPRTFRVTGSGFWQIHPGAAQALLDAVLGAARPTAGENAVDLYSGVGLFSAGLALRVGGRGQVLAVESDSRAVSDARRSLHDLPQVRLEAGRVERVLGRLAGPGTAMPNVDVVVADPPRSGLGAAVTRQVCRLGARVVVLVACDPAAMARDVASAAGHGYHLAALRAFDLFPMTHHVECVAVLRPAPDTAAGMERAGGLDAAATT